MVVFEVGPGPMRGGNQPPGSLGLKRKGASNFACCSMANLWLLLLALPLLELCAASSHWPRKHHRVVVLTTKGGAWEEQ